MSEKSHRPRVLITDANYKHTLGATRYLAKEGIEVDGIGLPHCLTRWSRYLSKIAFEQKYFHENHLDQFLSFLSQAAYDVLLPVGAQSVWLVARHKTEIEAFCSTPCPPAPLVALGMDKSLTYAHAQKAGIRFPATWNFSSYEEFSRFSGEIIFPAVIKSRLEAKKFPPVYVNHLENLSQALRNLQGSYADQPFPLIQQYIQGPGCGFFALYHQGVCKRVFMHRRIREYPPSGGPSCCAESVYEADLLTAGKQLLDTMGWHGVAMVEFKREARTGDLYLMELNPKFWGSLDLALASGVNFPLLAVQMALGEAISYSEDYQVGLRYHWPLDGDLAYGFKAPASFPAVLWDCLNPKVKSNFWLSDPLPSLYTLGDQTIRFLLPPKSPKYHDISTP